MSAFTNEMHDLCSKLNQTRNSANRNHLEKQHECRNLHMFGTSGYPRTHRVISSKFHCNDDISKTVANSEIIHRERQNSRLEAELEGIKKQMTKVKSQSARLLSERQQFNGDEHAVKESEVVTQHDLPEVNFVGESSEYFTEEEAIPASRKIQFTGQVNQDMAVCRRNG